MARRRRGRIVRVAGAALLLTILAAVALVFAQGRRTPAGTPTYVALGSSYAAGAGLGRIEPGSPLLCARSIGGYPHLLAERLRLPLVDMSCGGAVTRHLVAGGQFFQGAQVRVITPATRLVTITVGGNDVGYVADLSRLAARRTGTPFGRVVRTTWRGPVADADRGYGRLRADLLAVLRAVHAAAPGATVVLATYPPVVPRTGTCARLGLVAAEATRMRAVADTIAAVTAEAAARGGARLVDMNRLGIGHDACARAPWTTGWANGGIAPFHPTALGANATAAAIATAYRSIDGPANARDRLR